MLSTSTPAPPGARGAQRRDGILLQRLLWVAPLTLVLAVAANFAIKLVAQAINPAYQRMGQLQEPMVILTIEGVIAAVIVFAVVALVVPRPIFWYRTLGVCALVLSLLPDIALATGGQPMFTTMRIVGTLTSIGMGGPPPGGPPPGGRPGGPGGPPPGGGPPGGGGFNFTTPWDQVLLLMLLHVTTAVICIVLLTTLTRRRRATL